MDYQGHEALIVIETGELLAGKLPGRALRLVREWSEQHRAELRASWQRAQNLEMLERIPGADNDQAGYSEFAARQSPSIGL